MVGEDHGGGREVSYLLLPCLDQVTAPSASCLSDPSDGVIAGNLPCW